MPIGIGFGWLFTGPPGSGGGPRPPRRIETMLVVNNLPLQRTGLVLQRATGQLDNVSRVLPETARVPGLTGGRYEEFPAAPARDITLVGWLLDVTHEQLQQQLAMVHDAFDGELELEWPHAPGFVQYGVAGPAQVEPINPDKGYAHPDRQAWRVTIPIRCADGAAYARQPRRIRLGTTPKPIQLGGLAIGGEIVLEGPLTGSVDIDILSPSGVLLDRLALRGVSLPTIDDICTIRLDAPNTLVKRAATGIETPVYHWRSLALSTRWWKVSPRTADRARGIYPRVRLSTGGGWWRYLLAETL